MTEYLMRADLSFGHFKGVPVSTALPVKLGPFQLDQSPNAALYLTERGLYEPDQVGQVRRDSAFPMSLLYLERKVTCARGAPPTKHADDALDRLERLLRIFQSGEVSVRRHGVWRIHQNGGLTPGWSFSGYDFRPVKSPIEGLREYGDYPLDDATLGKVIKFVARFWDVLDAVPDNLQVAMARLSSSYEKRDGLDRLVDLVIALEALFGDRSGISTIAKRGGFWLYKTESERRNASKTIKKLYRHRSRVVHGGPGRNVREQEMNGLEAMVRSSLIKFLNCHVQQGKPPSPRDIDRLIMDGKFQ